MGRTTISTFSKEGLLKSVSGNACCGATEFQYLLEDPLVEAEEYPVAVKDAGDRVRSFAYYAGAEANEPGTVGQLKAVTDLAGEPYRLEYFKPSASSAQAGLKKVIGPEVSLLSGLVAETLLEYTYDSGEREKTVRYAGLAGVKEYFYETPEEGARHLASKVGSPFPPFYGPIELNLSFLV